MEMLVFRVCLKIQCRIFKCVGCFALWLHLCLFNDPVGYLFRYYAGFQREGGAWNRIGQVEFGIVSPLLGRGRIAYSRTTSCEHMNAICMRRDIVFITDDDGVRVEQRVNHVPCPATVRLGVKRRSYRVSFFSPKPSYFGRRPDTESSDV